MPLHDDDDNDDDDVHDDNNDDDDDDDDYHIHQRIVRSSAPICLYVVDGF